MSVLLIYMAMNFFFHFWISAATGAAAPGCSDTVNDAD